MTQKYTAQSIRREEMERRKLSLKEFGQGKGLKKIRMNYIRSIIFIATRDSYSTQTHTVDTHARTHTHARQTWRNSQVIFCGKHICMHALLTQDSHVASSVTPLHADCNLKSK